ncbi:MAG: cytochrome c oxidase accessory protein CcoG [Tistlia sp.]|uniref:cytochrome c oxidase accessory protein CcoG n=1 Tax=Tistlia sp. TaxID=3057121 RepID=UPI0034A2D6D7
MAEQVADDITADEVASVREQKATLKRQEAEQAPAGVDAPRQSLYADRVKVYPRQVRGTFRRLKWAALGILLAIYYLVPWIRWDRGPGAPDQAVLIDMPARRAYFFFIEIWPQEVYYLTGLLILASIGLFFVTSLAGRVWCGYACPQTVWTDLFMWVERLIEGDRNARMRLDRQPLSAGKVARKAAKHGVWLLIALVTGGAWIMYFKDAPTLVRELATLEASQTVWLFIGLFTATTYLLAGWAREQVCTYMCPWPRFQAAMFDEDTLIVTYQRWRGEPRGKLKKGENDDWSQRGDCIDCKACVAVCPTGIDIRDGQQLECINCALCIDACNDVMARIGRPPNLIAYDTEANQIAAEQGKPKPRYKLLRVRTLFYALLLVGVSAIMLGQLLFRDTLDINVLHERNPLFVTLSNGDIRNGYTVKLLNKTREPRAFVLTFEGIPGATMEVLGQQAGGQRVPLVAEPDSVATYDIQVRAPRSEVTEPSRPVTFTLTDPSRGETVVYDSVFRGPER